MGVSINECVKKMADLEKSVNRNAKKIELNIDLEVIPTITAEWQFKDYARLKTSQERQKTISLILKVISEVSAIAGAITVIAQIFLGIA